MALPRAVVFDLDGTLVEYNVEHIIREVERVAKAFNYRVPEQTTIRTLVTTNRLEDITHEQSDAPSFADFFWPHFDEENQPRPGLIDRVEHVFESLIDKNIRVGLVTARRSSEQVVLEELLSHGIGHHFETLVTQGSMNWTSKTDAFRQALVQLDIHPLDAWSVGDQPWDIRSGREAGFSKNIAVLTGGVTVEVLQEEQPDHLFESVEALMGILE